MEKKLIYIMNHYSINTSQHFNHITYLLESMADKGVKIALVIEKCEDSLIISHKNIKIICQKQKNGFNRFFELLIILRKLIKSGYSKTFIRISINAAIISIIASKLFGGKTYYWQSGTTLSIDKDKKFFKRIKWYIISYTRLWFVKTFIDKFVTGPETMINYYISALKIKPSKMLMLYNDIDVNRFKLVDKNEKIILMVHRLSPVRKTDKYIPEIFEDKIFEDNNVRLLIIGDGPEKELLNQKIMNSKMRERISLLGVKPNNEIEQFYRLADIFINPSYTEGFPRVVIEAMACGLPIIATNAGGTKDIFDKKQKKFVVDKENVKLFKKKLKELLLDNKLKNELSNENLIQVKKFSTDAVSDMYIERIFNNE